MSRLNHGFQPETVRFLDAVREALEQQDRENGRATSTRNGPRNARTQPLETPSAAPRREINLMPARKKQRPNSTNNIIPASPQDFQLSNNPSGSASRPERVAGTGVDVLAGNRPSQSRPSTAVSNTGLRLTPRSTAEPDIVNRDEVIDLIDDEDDCEATLASVDPVDTIPKASPKLPRFSFPSILEDSDDDDMTAPLDPNRAPQKSKPLASLNLREVTCIRDEPDESTKKKSMPVLHDLPRDSENQKRAKEESDGDSEDKKPRKRVKETRGATYRVAPSRDVLTRMSRMNIRLCLVDKKIGDEALEYCILGSNGNVYTTKIALTPTCDCPDFKKRQGGPKEGPCKHLIFVFLRVLKVNREDPCWWQKRLVPSELETIRERVSDVDQSVLADSRVIKRFQETKDEENVDCLVCYEELGGKEQSSRCSQCSKMFHKTCLRNWMGARQSLGQSNVTCPWCRKDMTKDELEGKQYDNLAQFSTQHERHLTLDELYAETHQYIRRGGKVSIGRGRGHTRGYGRGRK